MLGLPNPYVMGAAALVAVVAIAGAYIKGRGDGAAIADAKWLAVENERKDASAKVLKTATDRYIVAEADNLALTRKMEAKSNDDEKRITGLRIANGRLVDAAGGLLDRNGRPAGGRGDGAATATASATGTAAADAPGCRLSDAVTGDLLDFASAADSAAAYAQLGHEYAVMIEAWRVKHLPR